jgi:hypothetical protein
MARSCPWGAVVFINAHGEKLDEKISGRGVLLNQGVDGLTNFKTIQGAARIKRAIFHKCLPLEEYRHILTTEKQVILDYFKSGQFNPSSMSEETKIRARVFIASGSRLDESSLDCNDYLFERYDKDPIKQEAHSIEFVYIDPSLSQRSLGRNFFDKFPTVKLSHLVIAYNMLKSKLPLCVISLACQYDAVLNTSTLDFNRIEAIGAFMKSLYRSEDLHARVQRETHDREREYRQSRKKDRARKASNGNESDDMKEYLDGLFDGDSKRNPTRKKRNPKRKRKTRS